MNRLEKTPTSLTQHRFPNHVKNPSFSSTLLDEIYRSIDEGESNSGDMKFYREITGKKHSKSNNGKRGNTSVDEEQMATASLPRGCVSEKWMGEKKVSQKIGTRGRQQKTVIDRKLRHDNDHEYQDALFFSSTSTSSDSSCGGFSSSDTESMYGASSRASCFAPPRPKPVRTTVTSEKKDRRHSLQFDYHRDNSNRASHEDGLIKSKSRALKIYNNLKKVKQPISPGARLTSFLNSLFAPGNTRKSKPASSLGTYEHVNAERKLKSGQASASACSSASSFSRSCLSKTPSSTREKLRNGVKRSVHFYPVSVIVDEDSRPCGHKFLYEHSNHSLMMPVSVPTAWKIGRSPPNYKKNEVRESGREFLKEYLENQKKSDFIMMDLPMRTNEDEDEEGEDDEAASYASSDLFELDHLAVMENSRYCEELPVYETTHVSTNRAIANGLIM